MTTFYIGAGALLLGALAFVLVPLWSARRDSGNWSATGIAATVLLIPITLGVYLEIRTWNGESFEPGTLPPVAELIERLETRLAENPDDVLGWRLLGQSFAALGQYPQARQAFREAWGRTPVPDNELKLALAEAEVLTDRQALQGASGALFAEVLETDPNNPKALWYAGLAAMDTGEPEVARERWTQLLALGPPEPVAQILEQQLALLGGPAETSAEAHMAQADEASGAAVELRIRVAETLSEEVPGAGAALFIFARAPAGGPPVAVIRDSAAAVPGQFTLSDANAMLPGRSLADFEALTIVARLSASGEPTEQPGDLFGALEYRPADGGETLEILIDQVAQ